LADEGQTFWQRLWASFKYTLFFVLVAAILLLTGLLMKPRANHDGTGDSGDGQDKSSSASATVGGGAIEFNPELDWLNDLLNTIGKFDKQGSLWLLVWDHGPNECFLNCCFLPTRMSRTEARCFIFIFVLGGMEPLAFVAGVLALAGMAVLVFYTVRFLFSSSLLFLPITFLPKFNLDCCILR